MRQYRPDSINGTEEINLDRVLPSSPINFLDGAEWPMDASVVHEHVECAKIVNGLIHDRGNLCRIRYINWTPADHLTRAHLRTYVTCGSLKRLPVAGTQH